MPRRPALLLLLCLLLAGGAIAFGLAAGSSGWGWPDNPEIFTLIRLPRVLAGFGVGAALGISGTLLQVLTRNPLAEPYVLGISSGASVGALLALLGVLVVPIAAVPASVVGGLLGAAAATALLFLLARRHLRGAAFHQSAAMEAPVALLLIGVMLGTAASALIMLMMALASDQQLRGLFFWLLGDLNGVTSWLPVLLACLAALALVWPNARQLDLMARGEAWAWTLGVPVAKRKAQTLAAAALATGVAVATAGAISFVGLVVPHALRLAGARDARLLLPCAALAGGAFVVVADTVARTLFAPSQVPVGVISAAIGVPAFLYLLLRRDRGLSR
jgi:iron complex transport system permease protein